MIKETKNFMYKILGSSTGLSSKRFIAVFGFLVLVFIALIDLFTNLTVSEYVYEGLVFVILGGLGSTAAEHFGRRNDYKNINQYPDYNQYQNQQNPIQQQPPNYIEPIPPQK